jgi:molybdopterin adenylyltransferase
MYMWKIVVITVSDRSYAGERKDVTGPELINYLKDKTDLIEYKLIPDDMDMIKGELIKYSKIEKADLILTCGGTGFSKKDITPESTLEIIEREAPGIMEYIRSENAKKSPRSYLSRGICGIIGETIIINLPGSPDGAVCSYKIAEPLLSHCIELLKGEIKDCFSELL